MNRAIPQNRPALSAGTDHRPAALASPEACPPAGTDSRIPIGTLTHELRASNEQLENAHGGLIGIDESSLDGASSGSSFRLRKPRFLSPMSDDNAFVVRDSEVVVTLRGFSRCLELHSV